MSKRFLKYMPRCENSRNSRFFHFCVIKINIWSKFSNFKRLQIINEGQEWSKISIRAVFWHYECSKRFIFAKFKSCTFEKWPKCGRNMSFFSTVLLWSFLAVIHPNSFCLVYFSDTWWNIHVVSWDEALSFRHDRGMIPARIVICRPYYKASFFLSCPYRPVLFLLSRETHTLFPFFSSHNRWKILAEMVSTSSNGIGL